LPIPGKLEALQVLSVTQQRGWINLCEFPWARWVKRRRRELEVEMPTHWLTRQGLPASLLHGKMR